MTREDRALLLAMELLRVQVQDNAVALAANTLRLDSLVNAGAPAAGTSPPGTPVSSPPPGTAGASPPNAKPPAASPPGAAGSAASPAGAPPASSPGTKSLTPPPPPASGVPAPAPATKPPATPKDGGGSFLGGVLKLAVGPIAGVLGVVGAKFAAVAAPLALLGAVLSSATSGFGTAMTAVKVFASSLAPLILPFALMLGTALVSMADVINEVAMPVMEGFFSLVIDTLIPAIQWLAEQFEWAAKGVVGFVDSLDFFSDGARSLSDSLFGGSSQKTKDRTSGAMRDVLQSFKQSIAPKATIGGLGDIGRSVQLAALNADPLEARIAKQQLAVLEKIEAAVSKREATDRVYDPARRP